MWASVEDYHYPGGWNDPRRASERARWCCERLEAGQVVFFDGIPFNLPEADREFLLRQKQSDSHLHKNISYRPRQDELRGFASDNADDLRRLHEAMRHFSQGVVQFAGQVLTPYQQHWQLDYASFRPFEEQGRDLPMKRRNDLIHIDAFPTRPTHGNRILRVFTNINPTQPRVWQVAEAFDALAQKYGEEAGLTQFAARGSDRNGPVRATLNSLMRAVGLPTPRYSAYDRFMLHFHDYLKENTGFQQSPHHERFEFPPFCTWMVFTDQVPHAALSGRFALEQTFIIPIGAMVNPEKSPLRVLEAMVGRAMVSQALAA